MADDDDIKGGQEDFEGAFEEEPEFDPLAREREVAQSPERALASDEALVDDTTSRPRSKLIDPALVDLENMLEPNVDDTTPLIHMGTTSADSPPVTGPVRSSPSNLTQPAPVPEDINTPPLTPEDIEPPSILIDNLAVDERADGAVIGGLTVVGEPFGENRTYLIDDDRFEVVADQLKLRPGIGLNYDLEQEVPIQIEVTDANDITYAQKFTVMVNDINVAPVDIDLDNQRVAKLTPGAIVGQLSTFDPDLGDIHTYAVSDDRFEIVAGTLKVQDGVVLAADTEPTIDLDITATDTGGRAYTETFMLDVIDPVWPDDTPNESISSDPADAEIGDPFIASPPADEIASSTGSDIQLGTSNDETGVVDFMSPAVVEDMPYAASDLSDDMADISPPPDTALGWTIVFDDGNSLTGTGLDYMDLSNDVAGTIYFDDGSEFQFSDIEELQ